MIKRTKTDTIVLHCAATKASMDIGVEEINKYLMRKATRLEREMVDPAITPSKSKRKSPVWR